MRKQKIAGLVIDLAMYILMLVQMIYVFTGNDLHEWAGIGFFVCLVVHLIIKRKWFTALTKRKVKLFSARRFADLMIVLLMVDLLVLAFSSMGVSRTIFPGIHFLGNPEIHKFLATIGLTIAVIHGGMHGYFATSNKKKMGICIAIAAIIAFSIGQYAVPYLDRHFKTVSVDSTNYLDAEKYSFKGSKPLVVYFTRVGNTDFVENVDAVSGASLLIEDNELKGNTQFMAEYLVKALGCEAIPITLSDYKYPSSYSETCSIAGVELKNHTRPAIEPIDISDYESIVLIYPIWWGTIPMPVATFLEECNLDGKEVYLIATQGSSGFASSTKDIKALIPGADVHEVLSVYCDDIPKSGDMLIEWFMSHGLIDNK